MWFNINKGTIQNYANSLYTVQVIHRSNVKFQCIFISNSRYSQDIWCVKRTVFYCDWRKRKTILCSCLSCVINEIDIYTTTINYKLYDYFNILLLFPQNVAERFTVSTSKKFAGYYRGYIILVIFYLNNWYSLSNSELTTDLQVNSIRSVQKKFPKVDKKLQAAAESLSSRG